MKTKRRLFLFPILLMATFVFLTTGCSDDEDNNATPYSEKDIIGQWLGETNSSGDIEALKFNEDGSSWFGLYSEENSEISWLTKNDTWKLDGDFIVTEDESGFVLEYKVKMEDTVMTLVEKEAGTVFSKATLSGDPGDGEGDGEEYTMETMSGTFKNTAERIKVELSDDGSAILTKIEGDMTGQDGEVDDEATWEIDNYEAPAGVTSEDEPLSVIVEHANSEFDKPYVLIIESIDELKDHWQKTLSRVEDNGGDDAGDFQFAPEPHEDYTNMQLGMVSGGAEGELDNHPTYVFKEDGYADYYENGEKVTGTEDTPKGYPWKYEDGKLIVASFADRDFPTIELTEQDDGTFTSQKFDSDPEAVWEVDAGATDPSDIGGDYTMENLAGKWYKDNIGNDVWYQFNSDGTYEDYSGNLSGDWELDGTTITMTGDLAYTWLVKEENDEVILQRDGDATEKLYSEDAEVNGGDGGDDSGGDDDGGDDDEFSLYDISYFDKIEYNGEDENSHGEMYKEWTVSSSTHANLTMDIQVSSANGDGDIIGNATYDFGDSSDLPSGGAVGFIFDSESTDGWSYVGLYGGKIKVENSTESGCTITLTDAHNPNNPEHYFNGTAEVTF